MSEIAEAVIGIVIAIIFIVVGGIILWALVPINPFMAVVGIILLMVLGIAMVIGFIKSHS
jgi:uncharacterized membrane protein YfhO